MVLSRVTPGRMDPPRGAVMTSPPIIKKALEVPTSSKLYDHIYGMQTGVVADDMGWIVQL